MLPCRQCCRSHIQLAARAEYRKAAVVQVVSLVQKTDQVISELNTEQSRATWPRSHSTAERARGELCTPLKCHFPSVLGCRSCKANKRER